MPDSLLQKVKRHVLGMRQFADLAFFAPSGPRPQSASVPAGSAVAILITSLAILAGLLLFVPSLASTQSAHSQSELQAPAVRIHMGHHVVEWDAPPGTVYTVRLSNPKAVSSREPAGEKAFVTAYADENSLARVMLRYRTNAFAYALVEPGDRFEVGLVEGPTLLDFLVPDFRVDVSDDGRRIHGRAPAGSAVTVTLEAGISAAPFERVATADGAGQFTIDLPEASRLGEGEGGSALLAGDEGQRYTAVFARRWVEISVDSARILSRASQQSPISARRVVSQSGRLRSRGFKIDYPHQEGISADGRRKLIDDYPYLIRAGDMITVSQIGGALDRDDHWPREMPEFWVRQEGRRLLGQAPPGETVELQVLSPEETESQLRESLTADPDGRFALDLPAGLDLAAGWRALARIDTGDGIWLRAEMAVPRVEASVSAARLGVDLLPFQPMTVTLSAPDGSLRYTGMHRADADGRIETDLESGLQQPNSGWPILVELRPRDILEIELAAGDPLRLVIPRLNASSDPDAERISGQAEADQALEVELVDGEDRRHYPVLSDQNGRWSLDLAGEVDLEPTLYARVLAFNKGHRFFYYTAPRGLRIYPGRRDIESMPYVAYPTAVTLTTPSGQVAGGGQRILEPLDPPQPLYELGFHFDLFDDTVKVLAGDTVTWRNGHDAVSVIIPPLEARAHVGDDLVLGRTVPGGRVYIETDFYDPAINQTVELLADAQGVFQHQFEQYDLVYNNNIAVRLDWGRHQVVHNLELPGLALDLTTGRLSGHLEPGVALSARLGTADAPEASGQALTDSSARFALLLETTEGRLPSLPPGLPLQVEAPDAQLTREIDWQLPRLDFDVDADGLVRGHSEAGARLTVNRNASQFPNPSSSSSQRFTVGADGSWQATTDRKALAPGMITRASARLPDGHVVERRHIEPFLAVRYGSDQVCGVGMPDTAVRVHSRDASGRLLASAEGLVSRAGEFDLRLESQTDDPRVTLLEGQAITATVGETEIAYVLGPMSIELDLSRGRIRAQVLPDTSVILNSPARSCLRRDRFDGMAQGREGGGSPTYYLGSGPTGLIDRDFEMRTIAYGMDITVSNPEGHGYIGTVFPQASGTAWVDTHRIVGRTTPASEVQVQLLDTAGRLLASGRSRASADDGSFTAFLLDVTGQPATIQPGRSVEMTSGVTRSRLEVEPLSFDFDIDGGLWVQAPPGRRLELRFLHAGGSADLDVETDAAGHYRFLPEDVPPRAGWTMADLEGIDVVLPADRGNATGSAWRAEGRPGGRIWLPWVAWEGQ